MRVCNWAELAKGILLTTDHLVEYINWGGVGWKGTSTALEWTGHWSVDHDKLYFAILILGFSYSFHYFKMMMMIIVIMMMIVFYFVSKFKLLSSQTRGFDVLISDCPSLFTVGWMWARCCMIFICYMVLNRDRTFWPQGGAWQVELTTNLSRKD